MPKSDHAVLRLYYLSPDTSSTSVVAGIILRQVADSQSRRAELRCHFFSCPKAAASGLTSWPVIDGDLWIVMAGDAWFTMLGDVWFVAGYTCVPTWETG